MKRLIAYSSVSHLGFCMLGVFALNRLARPGGRLQMVNHGLSTGGLFALVGMIYERYHTREIAEFGGLARRTPGAGASSSWCCHVSSIGLPGLNGFAGEFLHAAGDVSARRWADAPPAWAGQFRVISVLAVLGVVLGAWYMLWLVQRVFFGPLKEPICTRGGRRPRRGAGPRPFAPRGVGAGPALRFHPLDRPLAGLLLLPAGPQGQRDFPTACRSAGAADGGGGTGVGGRRSGVGGRGSGVRGRGSGTGVGERGSGEEATRRGEVRDDSATTLGRNAVKLGRHSVAASCGTRDAMTQVRSGGFSRKSAARPPKGGTTSGAFPTACRRIAGARHGRSAQHATCAACGRNTDPRP